MGTARLIYLLFIKKLAPILKSSAGPTGKSGASLSGKGPGKFTLGSSSKTSTFGSSNKTSSSKTSGKAPTLGSSKPTSGLAPSSSKKSYESASFAPKSGKSRFGIIWIPSKKRNKKKDLVYSSINYDTKKDRSPSMYNYMSGDSSDLLKKKDEEASLLVPEQLKGPIATVASAGTATTIADAPSEKLLKHDNEDSKVFQKEAAGDANHKDLESKDALISNPDDKMDALPSNSDKKIDALAITPDKTKDVDKVDSMTQTTPQFTTSAPEEEDCATTCLFYTLQCCDCILM